MSDVVVHSDKLPTQPLSRSRADGAAPVEIDHERVERLGARVHRARLLLDAMDAEVRRDPEQLAFGRARCRRRGPGLAR